MNKLIELIEKYFNKYKELIMYVFFGGLTTVVNWIVFFPLRYFLEAYWPSLGSFWPGMESQLRVQIANAVSWCAAVIFAYYTNKKFVFKSKTDTKEESIREFEGFVGARFLSLIIESVWLIVGVSALHIGENIAKIIGAVVVVIFNYVAGKLFIFKDKDAGNNKFVKFLKEKLAPAVFTKTPSLKHVHNIIARYIVRILGLLAVAATPLYCCFITEYFYYSDKEKFTSFLQSRPESVIFGLTAVYLLYIVILLLVKKGWIASLVASVSMSLIAAENFSAVVLTGSCLSPSALNFETLFGFFKTGLPVNYILMIAAALLLAAVAFFAKTDVPLRWYVRVPAALLISIFIICSVSGEQKVSRLLDSRNLYIKETETQLSDSDYNGFTTSFIINAVGGDVRNPK